MQAFIAVSGRRKAERFIRLIAEQLAAEENLTSVFSIRPASDQQAVREARRGAAEVFRRYAPIFLAGIPRE